jgi:hypothetical protein
MSRSTRKESEERRRRNSAEEDPKKPSDGIRQRKSTKKIHYFQTAKFRRLSERP